MKITVIVLILLFVIIYYNKNKFNSIYKNNGFASIHAKYTMPIVYKNLISEDEANYIIDNAKHSFKESEIIGGFDKSIRKSKTMWMYRDDPVINEIIKRICILTNHDIDNTEPLQVVQYEPGGFYNDHHDACCDNDEKCTEFVQNGGQRVLTVLIYLNDSFTGGATRFSAIKKDIKPPKYGGVIFRPLEESSNKCHPLALHSGTPVNSGIKYVCNIWIREGKYN
jgi:prolyl 4-hydroxylase